MTASPSDDHDERPHQHPHEDQAGHDHEAATSSGDAHVHPDPEHAGHDHDDREHLHERGEHTVPGHRKGLKGAVYQLFKPHSHNSAASGDAALESNLQGIHAVKVSLVVLLVTAVAQVSLVLVTGSVALLADTIHNFSDALTSVPLWIAFVLARRASNRRYTYGYRRAEDLAGLFIVGMIALSALIAGAESIERLIEPRALTNPWLVVAAGFFGFLGNEAVASYRIRIGKKIGSAALVADGYHARTDGFTSLAVVFGAVGVMLGFPLADPIVGLLITVAILAVLRDALKQVLGRLMDAVDPALVDTIEHGALAVPGVLGINSIRVRWIGHRLEASLHATVDCSMTVADGHRVAEEIRHAAYHGVRRLDTILVHIDPCDHEDADHHAGTRRHDPAAPPHVPTVYSIDQPRLATSPIDTNLMATYSSIPTAPPSRP